MIISRTPYRVSFFGGGTDYPSWYRTEGGSVLSSSIDKYCYISCRYLPPFFDIRHRIVWSHIETVGTIQEILHPAIKGGLQFLGFDESNGLEIHHQGDLPARSGIGSSSTFSVGLIKALLALRGQEICKFDLATKAIDLEQNYLKESVGSQDQIAAAFGGLNVIRFLQNNTFEVNALNISKNRISDLEKNLLLLYTGESRMGGAVAAKVISSLKQNASHLKKLASMVDKAAQILIGDHSLEDFGGLLHESWMLKRELADCISNGMVDEIYQNALKHGALGGKLLGAGSKGFMLFYIPLEKQAAVKKALSNYLWVPIQLNSEGSSIIYHGSNF